VLAVRDRDVRVDGSQPVAVDVGLQRFGYLSGDPGSNRCCECGNGWDGSGAEEGVHPRLA
jgi:hypothetical protein